MNKTKIEWVKNLDGSQGYTCNSKTGCLNGCPYCYARKLAHGRLKERYLQNRNVPFPIQGNELLKTYNDPFYPRWWPERLDQIRNYGRKPSRPKGIFLNDMSDWMGDYWPEEWTRYEIETMKACPQHRFYTLTKQPQNLIKWSPFPDNCWVGVTATDYDTFVDACGNLGALRHKGDAQRVFISIEPLLSWDDDDKFTQSWLQHGEIDWLIIGQQTPASTKTQPKIEWIQEIVEAADKVGVPVFLKNNLESLIYNCDDDISWATNKELVLRQEFPK